jgi:hypothetical protein
MTNPMLVTVHGSRLYGLHHADSDYGTYMVAPGSARTHHSVRGSHDSVVVSYDQFMRSCDKGVPQALEAMFSPVASVDMFPWLRAGYRACGPVVRDTYLRTMKAFWEDGSLKRRRHACRLWLNLNALEEHSRFNPALTPEQVAWVKATADSGVFPLD